MGTERVLLRRGWTRLPLTSRISGSMVMLTEAYATPTDTMESVCAFLGFV